ncbi:DnaJ domain-containing protein [Capilliphycus salinus ALCB114379]|uniref:DnaJ domain-containing protein n=1 Tax=Capilliphycus salinus TaxID=2768948 RepID=UPI0039A6AC34
MDTADYYRQLGLRSGASLEAVKASYRRLARLYHPDVNPDHLAREKFIAVTEAYKFLLDVAQPEAKVVSQPEPTQTTVVSPPPFQPLRVKISRQEPALKRNVQLSEIEQKLKHNSYRELQQLLKYKRFPRAIALIEGLAQRIPQDIEIRQWQAITYQRFGRHLIKEKKLEKARSYLKKALKTDPHNRALWAEVERDFRQLEKVY